MAIFAPGDVVKLKSGGPPMTVVRNEDGFVHCQWFEKKVLKSGDFAEATLDAAEPTKIYVG